MTLSYLDLSTKFHPRLSKQCININKTKNTLQKGFIVMLQVSWATAGQGRSQCGLHKAKNTTWVQEKDWAFMRGQAQRAAAPGLELRNIHISAAAVRQGSKWQKVITKGTFHCTGSGELLARQRGGWKYPEHQNNSRLMLTCAHIDVQHLHWEQPAPKTLFSLGSKPAASLSLLAACSAPNPKALCPAPFLTKAAAVFTC